MKKILIFLALASLAYIMLRDRVFTSEKKLDEALETIVSGTLVDRNGKQVDAEIIDGVDFRLIYFSAQWCPPCRAFTPVLVDAYNRFKSSGRVELIFVSADRSEQDMFRYMREANMPWPAVRYGSEAARTLNSSLAGAGIPCLVMLDKQGTVIADSYEGSRYIGPNVVLDKLAGRMAAGTASTRQHLPKVTHHGK